MSFRTRLLGLDDDLLDNLPSVADSVRDITGTVRSGLADAVTPDAPEPAREAPPTPIDPWEDAPGIAGATTAPLTASLPTVTPRTAESDQRAYGMNFVHEPIRSSPTMDHPIPLGDTQDDPWAGEPLAGLDVNAQPDTAPQNKGLPGLAGFDPFGTTADESKALERAGTFDRRMGIARGAMQLLGGLGGIVGGATGVQGIGAVGQGLSAGGSAPIDSMRDTVQGRITQRQAQDMRRMQYGQAQEDRAAEQSDREANRAIRQASAESNAAVDRARVAQLETATRQAQNEMDAVGADAAAARNIVRHFAQGLNDNSGQAQQLRQAVNSPEFEGASAQTAREVLARYTQLAGTRHSGMLTGGGGGGSQQLVTDADGTPRWVTVGGRGRSGGNAPAAPLPVSNGTAEPAAAPIVRPRASGGAPRPVPAPVVAPAPILGAPGGSETIISAQTDPQWLQEVFVRQFGPDFMDNPNARTGYQGYLRQLTARDGSREQVLRAITTDAMTRARNPDAIVPPEHQPQYNAVAGRMGEAERKYIVPYVGIQANLRNAFNSVRAIPDLTSRAAAEANLFAALHGSATAAAAFDRAMNTHAATALASGIARARNSFGRAESGAAINQGEWELFDRILGHASSLNDAEDLTTGLQGLINRGEAEIQSIGDQSGLAPGVAYDYWTRQHAAAAEARRARRGSR